LPRLANESFVSMAERRGWTRLPADRGKPRVAYFADFYANYIDPTIALAAVEVLHHNGIEVHVPPKQASCGIAPLACGEVDGAQALAAKNLRILGDLARAGFTIVCSEPTAAVTIRTDYPDLSDDPDVRLVGSHTRELTAFLWDLHQQGKLRTDFQPLSLTLGHHVPCHVKALGQGVFGPRLLSLIPDLRVVTIDLSCSGMAGTFGLKEKNFDVSLAAGAAMLERFRDPALHFGSSECSTCRMQMEQGASKRSFHPVQYLALAYRLMPGLERRLRERVT
jgi:Fe-S oxidoreductase